MEQKSNELEELRQQMGLLRKKLTDEEILSDDMVRQAVYNYTKKMYGQRRTRIFWAVLFGAILTVGAWMDYGSIMAVAVTLGVVLVCCYIGYLSGAFKSVGDLASEVTFADIEEMRTQASRWHRPSFYLKLLVVGAAGALAWELVFHFRELQNGEVTVWRVVMAAVLTSVFMMLANAYTYWAHERKLLNRIDEAENGGL